MLYNLHHNNTQGRLSKDISGLYRTTFQPSSNYCLHFRFHLITRLPVTQVDWTVLPVSFFRLQPRAIMALARTHWTPGFVHWNLVESIGHQGLKITEGERTTIVQLNVEMTVPF